MPNVYVVMGSSGEYSDRIEWPVAAYLDKSKAKAHVEAATQSARQIESKREDRFAVTVSGANPHDPNMQMDYTGTSYYYLTVELRDGGHP